MMARVGWRASAALVLCAALFSTGAAQTPGAEYRLKERVLRVDSVVSNSVFYTVLVSEATPSTVGRSYKLNLNTFLADYALATAPPPPPPPPPDTAPDVRMVLYGGDNQTGAPGALLGPSISVQVLDSAGNGINGDTVLWQVTSGGGRLNKTFGVTISEFGKVGWSGAQWTLGPSGEQRALATHKRTGQTVAFTATLSGTPTDTTTPPPPPPPDTTAPAPVDTTVQVLARCDFNGNTLCAFSNNATPANTACNFNGVLGQCSAYQWIRNGRLEILYERNNPTQGIDSNKQIDLPAVNIGWREWLYVAGTWRFPSITPETRRWIDSVATANGITPISDTEYLNALRKWIYIDRGRANHAVLNVHGRMLKFSPAADVLNGVCESSAKVYNLYSFLSGELLDRDHRVEVWYRRSSGAGKADGELIVKLNGQSLGHITGICTNYSSTSTMWTVSLGQQFQFNGAYYEMRQVDDVVVGKK